MCGDMARDTRLSSGWGGVLVAVVLCCFCLVLGSSTYAWAATTPVAPGGDLSTTVAAGASGDVFELEKGTYTFSSAMTIDGEKTITLKGAGMDETILDCEHKGRAFVINKGTLILKDLTVQHCNHTDGGAINLQDGQLEGDRITFQENQAPGLVFDGWAGVILSLGSSTLSFTDSKFLRNTAGVAGAVWINSGRSNFKNVLFDSNLSRPGGFGGAAIPEGDSVNVFEDCEFVNNFGEFGGAIDDGTTAVTLLKNCYFHNNRALYGGSYYGFARAQATFENCRFRNETAVNSGGAAEISSQTTPVFKNCVFENNVANTACDVSIRGGLLTRIIDSKFGKPGKQPSSAAHVGVQGNAVIKGCEFEDGRALQGGSIYVLSPQRVTIEDCSFKNNKAVTFGGAIYLEGFLEPSTKADVTIQNCRFQNNKADASGGAILATGSSNFKISIEDCEFSNNEGSTGGGIAFEKDMTGKINKCKFRDNTASTGGAVSVTDDTEVFIDRSTFTSNSARFGGALSQNLDGRFRVEDSTFQKGEATFQGGMLFGSNLATGCSRFKDVMISDNQASVAGGAFYYAARAPPCKDDCDDCSFKGNKAGYGNSYATGPSVLKQRTDESRHLRPSEKFDMEFLVNDYYGQTLKGFIDMQVRIKVDNDSLRGTTELQPDREGVVLFKNLRWAVEPGEKRSIRYYSDPATTSLSYTVTIEDCNDDQILYERDDKWYCLDIQDPDPIAQYLTYAGVAVVLALSFVVLALLIWKRTQKPIQNASPLFCYLIVLGIILSTISVAMWVKAEHAMCVLRGWLLALGTSLIFGSLFVREWRLLWIFKNTRTDRRIITNMDLIKGLAVIITLNLIVLIVWTAVAPPYRTRSIDIGSDDEVTYECDVSFPSSVFIIILIVLQALLLAFDCVVAFLLRNIPSSFNESKYVAFTIYNSAIMMIVAIVLVIVFNDDKTAVLVIIALTILFGCLVALLVLFAPKLYLSFLKKSSLVKMLQAETTELYQEIWARERQINDLKTHGGTTQGTTGTGSPSDTTDSKASRS